MEHYSNYFYKGLVKSSTAATKAGHLAAPEGFPWLLLYATLKFRQVDDGDGEVVHPTGGRSKTVEAHFVGNIVCDLGGGTTAGFLDISSNTLLKVS